MSSTQSPSPSPPAGPGSTPEAASGTPAGATANPPAAQSPKTIYRQDYRQPEYTAEHIDLRFELYDDHADVLARTTLRRGPTVAADVPLRLYGVDLELRDLSRGAALLLDDRPLGADDIRIDGEVLTIPGERLGDAFELTVGTRIYPQKNTSLEGLYRSNGNFCTQCEAEGFRKITYSLDRPDVMAIYTTTIVADRTSCPVLLSNGNPVGAGELDDGRHWATWYDPHKKPSYLFALVAGDLACIEDSFQTRSGRRVALRLYVEPANVDQCEHAMRSLQKAMAWDEQVYGLEYDLDIYMIVAVGDFNMGAMENKGLNIFNTKYVLAKPQTATDTDYAGIEGVIAHEYFHNWTGNRVTCRDWFQLSLKEGLTVFRDQQFSADMGSRGVKRIDDVRLLRAVQFPEDAGPTAHPVRPDSYIEINNFYTATVYNKGAEVVRMLHTLLGADGFRRGMDMYFDRHDGEAVTCDDFVAAMEAANGVELTQFRRWYAQAGTPEIDVERAYDPQRQTLTLTLRQHCPATPGQSYKQPFHIPLTIGLLAPDGSALPLQLDGENCAAGTERTLELREADQTFRFVNLPQAPLPSLARGFSAPVRLNTGYSDDELSFLLAHDSDEFNRWEAGQQLAARTLLRLVAGRADQPADGEPAAGPAGWRIDEALSTAFERALQADIDPALRAQLLTLPTESYLIEQMDIADIDGIHAARRFLRRTLAERLRDPLRRLYRELHDTGPYRLDAEASGRRALKNVCLGYLMLLDDDPEPLALCQAQLDGATNMTDELGALAPLANSDCPQREPALEAFYRRWQDEALVVDKWFSIQATSTLPDTLTRVESLLGHPAFSHRNPNKVRALIGAFGHANPVRFHAADGAGYTFMADQIIAMNALNPQVAARLVSAFGRRRKFDPARQALMRAQLERILAAPDLSPDVYELTSKNLQN